MANKTPRCRETGRRHTARPTGNAPFAAGLALSSQMVWLLPVLTGFRNHGARPGRDAPARIPVRQKRYRRTIAWREH